MGVAGDEMVRKHHGLIGHELNELWETVEDRKAWCAAAHGIAKIWTGLSD